MISLIQSNFEVTPTRQQKLEFSGYTKDFDFMNKQQGQALALSEKLKKD